MTEEVSQYLGQIICYLSDTGTAAELSLEFACSDVPGRYASHSGLPGSPNLGGEYIHSLMTGLGFLTLLRSRIWFLM